jgi:hypothetical protein
MVSTELTGAGAGGVENDIPPAVTVIVLLETFTSADWETVCAFAGTARVRSKAPPPNNTCVSRLRSMTNSSELRPLRAATTRNRPAVIHHLINY